MYKKTTRQGVAATKDQIAECIKFLEHELDLVIESYGVNGKVTEPGGRRLAKMFNNTIKLLRKMKIERK